jgi:hypothetical protein
MDNVWINKYNPSFDNLIHNDKFSNKIYYLSEIIKKNELDLNVHLFGNEGSGKTTILKLLIPNLDTIYKKNYLDKEYAFTYNNIYLFDFNYINQTKYKEALNTIKSLSRTNLIQYNYKIIILENFYNHLDYLKYFKNVLEKYSNVTKFIIVSRFQMIQLKSFSYNLNIPFLDKKTFEKKIKKILKNNKVNIKKSKITIENIYKVYNDSFRNFKTTLLWTQYHIENDIKPTMLIKNKLIAKLLANISVLESKTFINIRKMISDLICIGINEIDLIKYSIFLINRNKSISFEKKKKVNNLINNYSKNLHHIEHNIVLIEKFFNDIVMIFN